MGAEINVAYTLKKEDGDSEDTGETGNSGNKVGTQLALCLPFVSRRFLTVLTDMQLGDVTMVNLRN